METVPQDMFNEILHLLLYDDLKTLSGCNKLFNKYTNSESYWRLRLKREFNLTRKESEISWIDCYREIVYSDLTYCKLIFTDKINRYGIGGYPIYETNMHIEHLDEIKKRYLIELYQELDEIDVNKIVKMVKVYYSQPILIIYARDKDLLGIQDDNGIFIQIKEGRPNNIIIIDDRFILDQINLDYLYKFIFDHPQLITNADDLLMYNHNMTDQEKNDHLNAVKLILDRLLNRYNPKLDNDKFDSDYILEYCSDYQGHGNLLQPWPYIKYVWRNDCICKP